MTKEVPSLDFQGGVSDPVEPPLNTNTSANLIPNSKIFLVVNQGPFWGRYMNKPEVEILMI
jgi:hypothetical protein